MGIIRSRILMAIVIVGLSAGALAATSKPLSADGPPRELRRRSLTIDDGNLLSLPEIHVAAGIATVVAFQVPLRDRGAFIADVKGLMNPLSQSDRFVVLVPKKNLPAPLPLNVSLTDGTVISFALLTTPADVDVQVDVALELQRSAVPESLAALKASLSSARALLEECQASSAAVGVAKISSLFLSQDLDAPRAFERHAIRGGDKQNRLLVQARWSYRLFGMTFLVLTVENRDPVRGWALGRAEVTLLGSGNPQVKVLSAEAELAMLPPETEEKVVVAFSVPPQAARQKLSLSLLEKEGSRNLVLAGLEL